CVSLAWTGCHAATHFPFISMVVSSIPQRDCGAPGVAQGEAIGVPGACNAGTVGACGNGGDVHGVPYKDLDGLETCHALGARAGPAAVPDVAGKLVVIAAAAVEAGAGIARRDIEAEDVAVEAIGFRSIPHLQVDMADAAGLREARPFGALGALEQV